MARSPRYAVYDPRDPRRGTVLADAVLGQIILGEGDTITKALLAATKALLAATLPPGTIVWDRTENRVAYVVPADRTR